MISQRRAMLGALWCLAVVLTFGWFFASCGMRAAHAAAPDWQVQRYASPDNVIWFYRAAPADTLILDGRFRLWPVGADSSLQKNQWDGTYVAAAKGTQFSLSRNGVRLRDGWYYAKRIAGVDSTFGKYYLHGDQAAIGAVDDSSLVSSAVTTAKIAASAVTTSKVADANVTTAKLADASVTSAKLGANLTIDGLTVIQSGEATIASGDGSVTVAMPGINDTDYIVLTGAANDWNHYAGLTYGVFAELATDEFLIKTQGDLSTTGDAIVWYVVLKKP